MIAGFLDRWCGIALTGVIMSAGVSAIAQPIEPDAPSAVTRGVIEEVVVTARRSEENLQDVPVAVSALSGRDLAREQINSATDLNGRIPSLVVNTGSQMRNTETPTIRGQGAQFSAPPGVVIYFAEVPLPSDPVASYQGGAGKFFDLENLQVLKGSQGTLFGRNTTGGAMLLVPAKPADVFAVSLKASASSVDGVNDAIARESIEAVVNMPLIEDMLFARVGVQFYDRAGFTEDVATGKDYDSKGYKTARASLLWRPDNRLESYTLFNYSESDDHGTATVIERINREGLNQAIPGAIGAGPLTMLIPGVDLAQVAEPGCAALNFYGPSSNCGQDILDEQAARGPRSVQLSANPNDILRSDLALNNTSFDITETLTLRNIVSYSILEHSYRWDLDGSRAAFNDFINPDDLDEADIITWTNELQLQGSALDGALSYVSGVFYEHTRAAGTIEGRSLLFVDVFQTYKQVKRSLAPFAQLTYDVGNAFESLAGLSLTIGARYTKDRNTGVASIRQVADGRFPIVDNTFSAAVDSEAATWTIGLDYALDDHLIYGKVSRGYKTGGIATVSVNPAHYTYEPEFVINYELGHKSDFEFGGMPLRINSALYYTDYTDQQVAAPDGYVDPNNPTPVPQIGQAIFNVGEAWIAGFETELTLPLTERLFIAATYGYTEAEYTEYNLEYNGATPVSDCSGQQREAGDTLELSCLPFKTTPKHQYSVSARYLLPIDSENGDVELSLSYTWVDEQYSAQTTQEHDEPGATLPDSGLLNASISWHNIFGSRWNLQLFGTNLEDKVYRISNSNQWNLTYIQSSIYSQPRVLGMNLSWYFE